MFIYLILIFFMQKKSSIFRTLWFLNSSIVVFQLVHSLWAQLGIINLCIIGAISYYIFVAHIFFQHTCTFDNF